VPRQRYTKATAIEGVEGVEGVLSSLQGMRHSSLEGRGCDDVMPFWIEDFLCVKDEILLLLVFIAKIISILF
jgi:hypothetical protein